MGEYNYKSLKSGLDLNLSLNNKHLPDIDY